MVIAGMVSVYYLIDPITHRIRYVGSTKDPEKRIRSHILLSESECKKKVEWIRKLRETGNRPVMVIYGEYERNEAFIIEQDIIMEMIELGYDLLNTRVFTGWMEGKRSKQKHMHRFETSFT